MKTPLGLFLFIASASITSICAQPVPPPLITVSGSAEVKVAPDEIYLRVGVESRDWGGSWSGPGYWGGRYSGANAMFQNGVQNIGGPAETAEGTVSLGQISVSAQVNVSFLIE